MALARPYIFSPWLKKCDGDGCWAVFLNDDGVRDDVGANNYNNNCH
jgi:hypothetical protein